MSNWKDIVHKHITSKEQIIQAYPDVFDGTGWLLGPPYHTQEVQKGYVAIEVKSLAVAWVMEKFHHFLFSSHFLLETDQKLLEAILSKSNNQATPRLQRILIKTFAYHFTVKYVPGNTNQLADCLSQLGGQKDTIKLPQLLIHQITNKLSVRSDSLIQM